MIHPDSLIWIKPRHGNHAKRPAAIGRVRPLRHDALQPHAADMPEHGRAVIRQVFNEPYGLPLGLPSGHCVSRFSAVVVALVGDNFKMIKSIVSRLGPKAALAAMTVCIFSSANAAIISVTATGHISSAFQEVDNQVVGNLTEYIGNSFSAKYIIDTKAAS
jgi:hypothetical protein